MTEKNTGDLEKILGTTHPKDMGDFLEQNKESMLSENNAFGDFMKQCFQEKKVLEQEVFLQADIPERYGYKLISGEKHTRQRDVILRLGYAAGLTLQEMQQALKLYRMPELYAKVPRDAMLMVCFNEHPGSIIDVNAFLKKQGLEPLRSSGTQE